MSRRMFSSSASSCFRVLSSSRVYIPNNCNKGPGCIWKCQRIKGNYIQVVITFFRSSSRAHTCFSLGMLVWIRVWQSYTYAWLLRVFFLRSFLYLSFADIASLLISLNAWWMSMSRSSAFNLSIYTCINNHHDLSEWSLQFFFGFCLSLRSLINIR